MARSKKHFLFKKIAGIKINYKAYEILKVLTNRIVKAFAYKNKLNYFLS